VKGNYNFRGYPAQKRKGSGVAKGKGSVSLVTVGGEKKKEDRESRISYKMGADGRGKKKLKRAGETRYFERKRGRGENDVSAAQRRLSVAIEKEVRGEYA